MFEFSLNPLADDPLAGEVLWIAEVFGIIVYLDGEELVRDNVEEGGGEAYQLHAVKAIALAMPVTTSNHLW
jgi:hypothetical protein